MKLIFDGCKTCGADALLKDEKLTNSLKELLPEDFTMQVSFINGSETNYIFGEVKDQFFDCFVCPKCGRKRLVFVYKKDSAESFKFKKRPFSEPSK